MEAYLGGKRVRLAAASSIGKGGEADVYALDSTRALKIYKTPDHPDLAGLPHEQQAAEQRIAQHQTKLRAFPAGLPPEVVAPLELATDRSGGRVIGYAMERITSPEALLRYADPAVRRGGLCANQVVALFRRLHGAVQGLHRANVVIGDFNDLNVLVTPDGRPRLIDADSFQFGTFAATVFTQRFVDPMLCDPAATTPRLVRPYGPNADWYAYAALLFQSLLCVGPWGGLHQPKDPLRRVAQGARALRRIWALHAEVRYPRPALDPRALPDDLLAALERIFVGDERGVFPAPLLAGLRFSSCAGCGLEHARVSCPVCLPGAGRTSQELVRVRGSVRARTVFFTRGTIVHASFDAGALCVVHHEAGAYRRESGALVAEDALDPRARFRTQGATTLRGRDRELAVFAPGAPLERCTIDAPGGEPAFVSNGRHRYGVSDGRLWRDRPSRFGTTMEPMGEVLADQTRLFVGPTFGLGLYRAGVLCIAFLFDAERNGILDTLRLPALPGEVIDLRCSLDERHAWLFVSHAHGGKLEHHCLVYARNGALLASAIAEADDGSWLGTLGGKVATGGMLLCAGDDGLSRVEVQAGALVRTRAFPDTEAFLDEGCTLLIGPEGLCVVGRQQITALKLTGSSTP